MRTGTTDCQLRTRIEIAKSQTAVIRSDRRSDRESIQQCRRSVVIDIDKVDDRTYVLLFGVSRSVRYHNYRRRFYELWNSITVTISVLGGSAATATVLAITGDAPLAVAALTALVALMSALDLAVSTVRKANHHAELARRFISLEKEFSHGKSLSDEQYERLTNERLEIEAAEPPPLRLLDKMCHYELLKALGDKRKPPLIPWWRRFLAHSFSQTQYMLKLDWPDQTATT